MKDKEFNEQRARFRKLVARWVTPLGLNQWKLDISYKREPIQAGDENFTTYENEFCPAQTRAHWQYQQAFIDFDVTAAPDYTDDDLEEMFVHELCHVLINEMREFKPGRGVRHEERVATQLANALRWTREAGFKEGRRRAANEGKKKSVKKGAAKGRKQGNPQAQQ